MTYSLNGSSPAKAYPNNPVAEVAEAVRMLARDARVVELRAVDVPSGRRDDGFVVTIAGYFDDFAQLAAGAVELSGQAPAVYITLNKINPALLARAANRLRKKPKQTTADADVLRRLWLPLDFDARRPSGISSSDAEHAAALQRARECRDWLTGLGWPAPVEADSGNGGHLLYAIDLPNDKLSTDRVKGCLEAVGWQWSDDEVEVDLTVFNAARIWKLYGTRCCKGDAIDGRPHRDARVLQFPSNLRNVTIEQLEQLASRSPRQDARTGPSVFTPGDGFDLDAWIPRHGLGVAFDGPWKNGGHRWILTDCPWNEAHTNRSAYIVRWPDGVIGAGCHHNGCAGKGWRELRPMFEPDCYDHEAGRAGGNDQAHRRADSTAPEEWQEVVPLYSVAAAAPFPLEVFPEGLQKFAAKAANAVGCPLDYLGVPMLALAGGAVGASRALAVKRNYIQRPLLYAAIVGPPGDAKTPALGLVAAPIHEAQQKFKAVYDQEAKVYEAEVARAKEQREEAPDKPVLLRVHVEDATVESLAPILMRNPRGVMLIRDELSAWVESANQYKNGRGSDRQFWLSNWAGVPACIDRKQQPVPVIIPHPFVGVVGGIQPDLLGVLGNPRGRADGSIDRILFAYPEERPVAGWTWDELGEEALAPWQECVQGLLALNMEPGPHGLRPFLVALTPDARPGWSELMNGLAREMNADGFAPHLRGPWAKLRVYAARLALIIHFIRFVAKQAPEQHVDKESIRRAGLLVAYFQSHARRVYCRMAADQETEAAHRVLEWVARAGVPEFKRWEAHKLLQSQGWFRRIEDLDEPLGRLVKHHFLRVRAAARNPNGGRPADPVYEVNPLWDRRVNRVNRVNPSAREVEDPDEGTLPGLPGDSWKDGDDGGPTRGDAYEGPDFEE